MLLSFVFVLLGSVALSFVKIVPEQIKTANGKFKTTGVKYTIWHFGFAQGIVYLLPPILAVLLAIVLARSPERRRTWNWGLFALFLLAVMGGGKTIYAAAIASLGWGCWIARKAALDAVGGDARLLRQQSLERRRRRPTKGRKGAIDTKAKDVTDS